MNRRAFLLGSAAAVVAAPAAAPKTARRAIKWIDGCGWIDPVRDTPSIAAETSYEFAAYEREVLKAIAESMDMTSAQVTAAYGPISQSATRRLIRQQYEINGRREAFWRNLGEKTYLVEDGRASIVDPERVKWENGSTIRLMAAPASHSMGGVSIQELDAWEGDLDQEQEGDAL